MNFKCLYQSHEIKDHLTKEGKKNGYKLHFSDIASEVIKNVEGIGMGFKKGKILYLGI